MLERNPERLRTPWRQDRPPLVEDDGSIGGAELLAFVRGNLLLICACLATGLFVGGVYVASEQPTYTARTQILIDLKTPTLLDASGREIETSLDTAEVESQMTVLRSDLIANMVIDELGLTDDPEFLGERPSRMEMLRRAAEDTGVRSGLLSLETVEDWRRARTPEAEPPDPAEAAVPEAAAAEPAAAGAAPSEDEAAQLAKAAEARRRLTVAIFHGKLFVSRVSVSYVIEIAFSANDPEKAAQIANKTAEAYLQEQLLSKIAAMEQGNAWLEARLDELRRKLNAATQATQVFRARHDYQIPQMSANDISAVTEGNVPEQRSSAPTLEELEATADTYRRLYGSVLETYTSSMQQKSYPYSLVRVISPATPPFEQSHPRTKITAIFGGLSGLLVGIGLAFTRQSLDPSIRGSRQIRSDIGVNCLVEIPRFRSWGRGRSGLAECARHPHSRFAEAVSQLKTAIRVNAKTDGSIAIGITSAGRQEGKSTLASNLGLVCAQAGYRTLVVDGDPLRRTLGTWFGKSSNASDTSEDSAQPPAPGCPERREGWYDFLLWRLGESPGDWARTAAQAKSWHAFQPGYDVVIVDLPPIESAIDVLPALTPLDYLVIVAEWGTTRVDSVVEAIRVADLVCPPLLGVVLNKTAAPLRVSRPLYRRG